MEAIQARTTTSLVRGSSPWTGAATMLRTLVATSLLITAAATCSASPGEVAQGCLTFAVRRSQHVQNDAGPLAMVTSSSTQKSDSSFTET